MFMALMLTCIPLQVAKGQIYNIQDAKAITFDGMARACAKAMGKDPDG
jgi:nucleoside-diphosphate-sugar epimerase